MEKDTYEILKFQYDKGRHHKISYQKYFFEKM